ncbi:hypothetical protein PFISCL1PPCAC_1457 [Pristionchus fissidentatus]|uniref:Glutathione S-transferase n=1 Tax=Pristionchus fissidentatus TaxID=1538716 RepID=A0AAV5USM9_9BILA|nr:hypothetical protein PFISCL1PPCAC_1457 [Pristionchus fissidentatus]
MVKFVSWSDEPIPLLKRALGFRTISVTVKTQTEDFGMDALRNFIMDTREEEILKPTYSYNAPEYILYDDIEQEESLLIRMIFAFSNVPYETRTVEENGTDFYGFPFASTPVLELNGLRLSSVNTICRHLAWRYDLSGRTSAEDAIVDVVTDAVNDAKKRLERWLKIAEYREWDDYEMEGLEEKTHRLFISFIGPAFEEILRRNGGNWVVGDEATWADLALASFINPIIFHRPNFFDRLPLLYNHCRRVADMECLAGMLYNIRERSFKKDDSCSLPPSQCALLPGVPRRKTHNPISLF